VNGNEVYGSFCVQDGFLRCRRVVVPEGTRGRKYITFNNLRIARQEKDGTWMAVEPGWTVTKTGPVDVRVQHDGREGVTLPFRAGMRG
jgi:hypothetical protein